MIVITHNNLKKWKANSIKIARKLGYNESILNSLDANVELKVNHSKIPKGMWYGFVNYDKKNPVVEVYSKNLSCESIHAIVEELRNKGVPKGTTKLVAFLLKLTPRKLFFNIYNQSGMDHELIGHIYNWFSKKEYDERVAVKVNLEFINARGGFSFLKLPWNVFSIFAPILLFYHKKDEFY